MDVYPLSNYRNIGIMAHIDAGKTTLTERILYYTGKNYKIGEVHDGTATMDYMVQEQERGITITAAATTCSWEGHRINIIDTPGHVDFTIEVERSLRVLDGAIAVLCGVAGVQPQTETVWRQANKYKVPRLLFVNKIDRVGADLFYVVNMVRQKFIVEPLLMQISVGSGENFEGVIDLIKMRMIKWESESLGKNFEFLEIPKEYLDDAIRYRNELFEILSDYDEDVFECFLDNKEACEESIWRALRKATLSCKVVPVFCGTALKNKGIQPLLDAVVKLLPSPIDRGSVFGHGVDNYDKKIEFKPEIDEELSALAFKITNDTFAGQLSFLRIYSGSIKVGQSVYNSSVKKRERVSKILLMHANKREEINEASVGDIVAVLGFRATVTGNTICSEKKPALLEIIDIPEPVIFIAIEPKSKVDEEKLEDSLQKLMVEDPTFKVSLNKETGQKIISGMGELHLEIIVDRLTRDFKVMAKVGKPQVAYKETVSGICSATATFDREISGKKAYAQIGISLNRGEKSSGILINFNNDNLKNINKNYIEVIKKSFIDTATSGMLGGYPVSDIIISVETLNYNEQEISEIAFSASASMAFREAYVKGNPILLEPIMSVEVICSENYIGDVISDYGTRRGRVIDMGINQLGERFVLAEVPLATMFGYSTSLRSLTQGRSSYTMQFKEYESVPKDLTASILNPYGY